MKKRFLIIWVIACCPEKNISVHELASANNALREIIFINIHTKTL